MKHHLTAFNRLLVAAAFSTLVAACSGGGGGGGSSTPVVPSDVFRITCTVVESVGGNKVAVEDATVIFNAKGNSYNTQTNASGKCSLDVPAADVQAAAGSSLTWAAASVVKDGFEPNTIICQNAKTGTACDQEVVLVRITTNTSLPDSGDVVMHIGDGSFDGQINSKLQKTTDGQSFDFTIGDWGTKLAAHPEWTRATVVLDAKGWQTTIAPSCNNTIAIAGNVGTQIQAGGNSNADGEWSISKFEFDIAQIGRSGAATLRVASGNCGGGADIDDVETNRIRVYFCDAATVGECTPKP